MSDHSVTRLLEDVARGAPGSEDRLFDRVYDELKSMAARRVAGEGSSHATRSPTALVDDAYERLKGEAFENRRHLFFAYARAMQQILVERARRRRAAKRGGDRVHVSIADAEPAGRDGGPANALDALEIADVLGRLRAASPREADVVELRFFGGLRDSDIAEILGVEARTVRRDWVKARARCVHWLRGDASDQRGRRP